jgi:hypothetical protein
VNSFITQPQYEPERKHISLLSSRVVVFLGIFSLIVMSRIIVVVIVAKALISNLCSEPKMCREMGEAWAVICGRRLRSGEKKGWKIKIWDSRDQEEEFIGY